MSEQNIEIPISVEDNINVVHENYFTSFNLPNKSCGQDLTTIDGRIEARYYDSHIVIDNEINLKELANDIASSKKVSLLALPKDQIIHILSEIHEPIIRGKFKRSSDVICLMKLHEIGIELFDLRAFFDYEESDSDSESDSESESVNDAKNKEPLVLIPDEKLKFAVECIELSPIENDHDSADITLCLKGTECKTKIRYTMNDKAYFYDFNVDMNNKCCKFLIDMLMNECYLGFDVGNSNYQVYTMCVLDFLITLHKKASEPEPFDFSEEYEGSDVEDDSWWKLPLRPKQQSIDCDLEPPNHRLEYLYENVSFHPNCSLYAVKLDYGKFIKYALVSKSDEYLISNGTWMGEIVHDNIFTRTLLEMLCSTDNETIQKLIIKYISSLWD